MRTTCESVDLVPVGKATDEMVLSTDLLVVGGPTHAHAMTRASTRDAAVKQAATAGLSMDADAGSPTGLREWLESLPDVHAKTAAAFDTRVDVAPVLSGRASRGIANRLHRKGFTLVTRPHSFVVDKVPQLLPGESEHAVDWGADLAALAAVTSQS
jgi:hypothetical protein